MAVVESVAGENEDSMGLSVAPCHRWRTRQREQGTEKCHRYAELTCLLVGDLRL